MMDPTRYAVYPPTEPGLPFLAVVLAGGALLQTFACPDRQSALRILGQMRARLSAKSGCWVESGPPERIEYASLYVFAPESHATRPRKPGAVGSVLRARAT